MTYSQVWWPILGICALHLPIQVNTHTAVNTHPEQWAAIYAVLAVGGSVPCSSAPSVANLATFSDPFSDFSFLKRLATNLATFGKTLATFQMSPVLSCEREILSYSSPCVCSDQWALAPAERSSTFQWPHGSWHRCQWVAHVHTVLPRTNHLPASPLFEIKLFNLTVFSSAFFFMHLYYSLSQNFSSFQFLNSSKIAYWATSERLYVIVLKLLIHNNKLN